MNPAPILANQSPSSEGELAFAEKVFHYFGTGESRSPVLHDISLAIPPGQLVIMTGPSGSGKTTLLTLMGALRSGQEGELRVLGRSVVGLAESGLMELRRNIGFIFQLHNLLESLTAVDNVMMAAQLRRETAHDARARALGLLDRLGLGARTRHRPNELSGGQRQRVAVARALVNHPRLILADEPTAALDMAATIDVVTLLQERIALDGSSCLMVTHDNRILDRADRIVSLVDGRIVSDIAIREQVILCEMLSRIDLFAALDAAALSEVADRMGKRPFAARDVLIRQGEEGELFFLLRRGEVDVHVEDNTRSEIVASLDAGRYFGERALITGERRNATIVARSDGIAYTLDKPTFTAAVAATPSLQEQIRDRYFARR